MAAQLDVALGGIIQAGSCTSMAGWPASAAAAAAVASYKKRKSAGYWEEERDMVVQLMMGRPLHHHLDVNRPSSNSSTTPPPCGVGAASALALAPLFPKKPADVAASFATLDLLGSSTSTARSPPPPLDDASISSSCSFDLDSHSPLPSGWEKCLDLQTGSIYYLNRSTGASTSSDPRKATASSVNWPTSPSSSSDLTFEANVGMASSSQPISTTLVKEGPNYESNHLDLTLSLKPSSPRLRPNSLNHPLNHDPKSDLSHNLRSLISSQGLLNNQTSLPFNSIKASFAKVPTCTSSTTAYVTSPASTLFFQDLNHVSQDMGSSISSKEFQSKSKVMNHQSVNVNGISRPMRQNLNMEKAIAREITHSPGSRSKEFMSESAKASKPSMSDTQHMNASTSSPMMTVGCANCLMFVMLPHSCSPKCPRCGASIDSDLPPPPSPLKKPKLCFSLMN